MAKRKNKTSKKHVSHVGVVAGMIGTVFELAFTSGKGAVGGTAPAVNWLMDKSQTVPNRLKYAFSAMEANAKEVTTWTPLVGGALITASPKIPLVRKIAAPVNTQLKTWSRGRMGL